MLSSSESEDEGVQPTTLSINKKFATKFEQQQRYKDLQRAKELEAELEESESDSESEDEEANALSTELDLEIFNTIKSIREGDKKIYDKNTTWYNEPSDDDEDDGEGSDAKDSTKKKKTYKDIVRQQLLEQGSVDESEEEEAIATVRGKSAALAYDREQQALRKSFLDSAKGLSDSDGDEAADGMLTVRPKTDKEKEKEKLLLKSALDQIVDVKGESAQEGDKFLYDYMLNKKWNFPKNDARDLMGGRGGDPFGIVDEDEEETEAVDNFESKYNFRFEELNDGDGRGADGSISVVGHSRNVEGSVRRVDDRRKKTRESRKERKEKEKRQKEAELKRLKNLKKQELEERLNKILAVGGLSDKDQQEAMALLGDDLDEEWDPVKHEEKMRRQFGDDYYAAEENDEQFVEKVKSGQIAADEDGEEGYYGDDGNNVVDYDDEYDDEYDGEGYGEEEGESNLPNAASEAILNSLYKLDYEDIVGGIPCRFKYKTVEKEDYGLAVDDILLADDKALNKFVGLKKLAPYYKKRQGVDDASKWSKKRRRLREEIKEKLAAAEAAEPVEEAEGRRSKKVKREDPAEAVPAVADDGADKKKRTRRKKKASEAPQLINKFTAEQSADVAAASSMHQKTEKKVKKSKKEPTETDAKKRRLDLYN